MNKTIKKIVAVGTTLAVFGMTASAAVLGATLADYPAPFVVDGAFAGKIVLGEKAATIDTIGALDISASLQRASSTSVQSSGAETQLQSGIRLDTTGDRIYVGGNFTVDAVTGDDLTMLKDGQFEDDEGTIYDYTQSVVFSKKQPLAYGQHDESDIDSFLAFDLDNTVSSTSNLYATKVDFTKTLNSTDANVIGNKITLFGNEYTFSSESTVAKLVLYGSSQEVSLSPKDEVTQTIDGKEYKVKIVGFGSSNNRVIISVNGQSDNVAEGASKTINGLKIYAKSVSSWNNGIDGFATLQLGAQKVVLEDGQAVAVGSSETDVEGTEVAIGGSPGAMTSLYIYVNAPDSDHDFIQEGNSFTDPVYKTFKIQYVDNRFGPSDATRDMLTVRASGSHKAYVKVPVIGGTEKTVYFSYDGALKWDSTKTIYPVEGMSVPEDGYMYLAPTDPKYTHFVRVKNIKAHATEGYVEFEDVLSGSEYKTNEGVFDTAGNALDLTVDGKQYKVNLTSATPGSETIKATYGALSGTDIVVFPEIELKNGETFALLGNVSGLSSLGITSMILPGEDTGTTQATPTIVGSVQTLQVSNVNYTFHNVTGFLDKISVTGSGFPNLLIKQEEDDANARDVIRVPTIYDANGVDVSTPAFSGLSFSGTMKDDDTDGYINLFGTLITKNDASGDNNVEVKIWYPNDQMYANVFIAPIAATASVVSSSGSVSLNPIAVGMAISDSEATLGSKPYIVVGGPCANTVAAALMGSPLDCAAGFVEGKAMIKLYDSQNALLVAGATGKDTQGASRVLSLYNSPQFAGKFTGTELEVVTTNLNSLTVGNVQ